MMSDNWHQYSQRMAVCSSSSTNSKERKRKPFTGKTSEIVVVDEEDIENAKKSMVPKNTRKATN